MPDILDEIIDRLSPSTLKKVLDFNTESSHFSKNLDNLLNEAQQIKINRINKELKGKIADLKYKTAENNSYLLKLKNDLEDMKSVKEPSGNPQALEAYTMKIKELEGQVKNLTKEHEEIDLTLLFNDTENLHQQIEEYKKKISEVKSKYKAYEGFPPNIEEGKKMIEKVKEQIRYNESLIG